MDNLPQNDQPPHVPRVVPEDSKPIDKWFWFKESRKWVQNSRQSLVDNIKAIQDTVKWFFAISTAGAVLGVSFTDSLSQKLQSNDFVLWIFICLILSFTIGSAARIFATRLNFEAEDSDSIKKAHNRNVIIGNVLLTVAVVCLGAGVFLIPYSVVAYKKPKINSSDVVIQGDITVDQVKKGPNTYYLPRVCNMTTKFQSTTKTLVRIELKPEFGQKRILCGPFEISMDTLSFNSFNIIGADTLKSKDEVYCVVEIMNTDPRQFYTKKLELRK